MTFHPTMKRRLHERLHPLIGEEEADALLDEISPPDPITREWLQDRFDLIDERFARVDERFTFQDQRFVTKEYLDERLDHFVTKEHLDLRFERMEGRFEGMDGRFEGMEGRFEGMDGRLEGMEGRLEGMEGRLRGEIGHLDAKMSERFRQHTYFMVGMATFIAVVSGVVQAVIGG